MLAVHEAHLGAAPKAVVDGREISVGAATYRLGAAPADAHARAARLDHSGRLVVDGDADLAAKLARGAGSDLRSEGAAVRTLFNLGALGLATLVAAHASAQVPPPAPPERAPVADPTVDPGRARHDRAGAGRGRERRRRP